jgi:hypothetical protein
VMLRKKTGHKVYFAGKLIYVTLTTVHTCIEVFANADTNSEHITFYLRISPNFSIMLVVLLFFLYVVVLVKSFLHAELDQYFPLCTLDALASGQTLHGLSHSPRDPFMLT